MCQNQYRYITFLFPPEINNKIKIQKSKAESPSFGQQHKFTPFKKQKALDRILLSVKDE